MRVFISLSLVVLLAVSSSAAQENRAVIGLLAQYEVAKLPVQKARLVVQMQKHKSVDALARIFRDLVYPLDGDRGNTFDRSNSDFLRTQIATTLKHYVSLTSEQLYSYFFAARKVVENETSRDVVLATIKSMAIWAKSHTDQFRMLLGVSLKRRFGKTNLRDRAMMTGIIEALGMIKQDTESFKLLNSFLSLGLDNDLTRKVKAALAAN